MINVPRLSLCLLVLTACADPLQEPGGVDDAPAPLQPGTPPAAACDFGSPNAGTLVITTTDFATGAISILDADGTLHTDVAVGSSDAIPYPAPSGLAVVHRHGHDFVDLLEPGSWRSRAQHALEAPDASAPNPHAIVFDDDGLGYVTLFGSESLLVLDPTAPVGEAIEDVIDLSGFADDDGRPEASVAVRCGDTLWVGTQRIDVPGGYKRVDHDVLVAVDLSTRLPWDFDETAEGGQGLVLQGAWLKQLRPDPTNAHGFLGLTSGIERIDLETLESSWLVDPEAFAAVGIQHEQQPLAFTLDPSGRWAWVAAYVAQGEASCAIDPGPCFDHAQLFEIDLHADVPTLVPFGQPFQAVERTVARIDDTLWVGSRETEAPGLYGYDLSVHPPVLQHGPLSTGLPPYSLTAIAP